jgi:hypothetical protein
VRWDTKLSSGFAPSGHTVSVFGVYKDGQMSTEAWDALRPRFEPILGGRECETARGNSLAQSDNPVQAAIDDYTRTNGPTDDLLAQVAPAARGDLILVLVEAGRLPPQEKTTPVADTPSPGGPGGTGGKGGLRTFDTKRRAPEPDLLQLTASLFSVAQGRSVALLDLQYTGDSIDEAIEQFTARVGRTFPATTCAGWNWQASVDPERIRKLEQ